MFSKSSVAMPGKIVCAVATAMIFSCIAAGLTVALPGTPDSAGDEAFLARADFDLVFASVNAGSHIEDIQKTATVTTFDQVFASMMTYRLDDTPPNREKLRNAGWRRILQKS
jgi:hypothetical protein